MSIAGFVSNRPKRMCELLLYPVYHPTFAQNCCSCMLQSVFVGLVEHVPVLSNETLGVR